MPLSWPAQTLPAALPLNLRDPAAAAAAAAVTLPSQVLMEGGSGRCPGPNHCAASAGGT